MADGLGDAHFAVGERATEIEEIDHAVRSGDRVGDFTGLVSCGLSWSGLTGMGQLYTAFSGDAKGGEGVSQIGDILNGPATGIPTLVLTGNPSLAQRNANIESAYTAGAGLVGATSLKDKLASGIDEALGIFGVTGAGCHP